MVKSEVTMPVQGQRRAAEELAMESGRLVGESAPPVAQVARNLGIPDHVGDPGTGLLTHAEACFLRELSPSTSCTSMPQGFTDPSACLASRLHAFATNFDE